MLEHIGWNTKNDFVESLLQEMSAHDANTIAEGDKVLSNFIMVMKYAMLETGKEIKEFKWTYNIEEYKATFSKTSEPTACGPSGLHMTHRKTALERDAIMRVHLFYI